MIRVAKARELSAYIDVETVCPETVSIDVDRLQAFLAVSGDRQAIHLPVADRAAVIPANLLLAVSPAALQSGVQVSAFKACFTAGYRKIRFLETVTVGQAMELYYTISSVRHLRRKTYVVLRLELRDKSSAQKLAEFWQTDVYIDADG